MQMAMCLGLGCGSLDSGRVIAEEHRLIGSVSHQWLLPRMKAVVHHGGAGTTAAGLIAGKPTLIIPHTDDQPTWRQRVWEMGVGAKPIRKKYLIAESLEHGLRELMQPELSENAQRLSAKLQQERGVEKAVAIILETVQPYAGR